jgi:hypothetical protein
VGHRKWQRLNQPRPLESAAKAPRHTCIESAQNGHVIRGLFFEDPPPLLFPFFPWMICLSEHKKNGSPESPRNAAPDSVDGQNPDSKISDPSACFCPETRSLGARFGATRGIHFEKKVGKITSKKRGRGSAFYQFYHPLYKGRGPFCADSRGVGSFCRLTSQR